MQNTGGRLPEIRSLRSLHPLPEVASRYIDLRPDGAEFSALCPFHADRNPSLSIYRKPDSDWHYHCFACGAHGDVFDFVREIEQLADTGAAIKRLHGDPTPPVRIEYAPPPETHAWQPLIPVPAHAGEPFAGSQWKFWNPKRDREWTPRPAGAWTYADASGALLGYVIRVDFADGKKITPAVTYCVNTETGEERWCMRPFPRPAPLYDLQDLAARPDAPVLVVSGEKCALAGAALLRSQVVITWPGGDQNAAHADWSVLAGRRVTLWMDADKSGRKAGDVIGRIIAPNVAQLREIDTTGQPEGWDIADAIAEGMDRAAVLEFCRQRVRPWAPLPEPEAQKSPGTEGGDAEALPADGESAHGAEPSYDATGEDIVSPDETDATPVRTVEGTLEGTGVPAGETYAQTITWQELGLRLSDKNVPIPNLHNACVIVERHPALQGNVWYDEFDGRVWTTWRSQNGQPREWTDTDDSMLCLWVQRALGISQIKTGTIAEAVTVVAHAAKRNALREWVDSLSWDGTPRLERMLPEVFGTPDDEYHRAVGRCWIMGMVRRALEPGCKVDNMPVFEGGQGLRKSTCMEALLGKRWFAEASESPTSKDFYQVLQGKLLVEIAELDAFGRAEVNTIKRVITCKVDRYRAPYGRRAEDHPRSCVFAGTTNKDDWSQDETGARRFWPVACRKADADWIFANRDQLFAEAMVLCAKGLPHWDVPEDEAKRQQEMRRASDEWEDLVEVWAIGRVEITAGEVLRDALQIEPDKWTKSDQMRIAKVLRAMGFERRSVWRGGRTQKLWVRPGTEPGEI